MQIKPTLLVLAAGMASRYGSLKQIDAFGPNGETIIDYSIYDAIRAGFGKVVFVIRKSIENEFKAIMLNKFSGQIEVDYVLQELDKLPAGLQAPADRVKPWGTAHAIWVAGAKIKEPFAVINGDDFYGFRSFKAICDFLTHNQAQEIGLVGYRLANTLSEHGAVSRGICAIDANGYLRSVTEQTHIATTGRGIVAQGQDEEVRLTGEEVVSMNLMGFPPTVFPYFEEHLTGFIRQQAEQPDPKAEFFLPGVVDALVKAGRAQVKVLSSPEKWFGVTYPADKPLAVKTLRSLIEAGVYPENLWKKNLQEA
ncbi:sugar phosphate nucleotidyltransferase [Rufibacter sp. XAAS-G3-1]|uniref:nucleotidyltransferase family protein n=1 Tax=Rufibacter sp. XAAS-G3-1 TaxID=2729134 RepID=UPI0015E77E34|nr:sugar phosphate nucleotidyltransferase [Rufibacter sp. XAAS-G3-1]